LRLPRWTAYAALALIFAMAIAAFPRSSRREAEPAPAAARPVVPAPNPEHPRVVVLGIDGMDPRILRDVIERYPERMPSFRRLAEEGGIHELASATPPQSPVAWSNFITGLDPGGHGIFDFIHRDPMHRAPAPATARSEEGGAFPLWDDWQLPYGGSVESNRSGKAFWSILAEHGVAADIWRMPANFPVEPARGLSFSGMMTPALDSAYGEFTLFTTNPPASARISGGKIVAVTEFGGKVDTRLAGPPNPFRKGNPPATAPLTLLVDRENRAVAVDTGGTKLVLSPGQWSDFARVTFEMLPMGANAVSGVVRFYLRSIEPELELYASPVNIDPADPVAPVSAPEDASARLADRRGGGIGTFYTQGMPEDVNALKAEVLSVPEFMQQASLVHDEGVRMLDWALDHYLAKPEGGLLFFYFSEIDLCSHMLWRHFDGDHPFHDPRIAAQDSSPWSARPGSTWQEAIHDLYMGMDPVLGRLRERLPADATLIVMSDHGFASYARKFNLNTWLLENGYLVLHGERELPSGDAGHVPVYVHDPGVVDWSRTKAYGVGFNALYLNLAGRELDDPATPADESGSVQPGAEADALVAELKRKLEAVVDPANGNRPILRCDLAREVYRGERLAEAPELIVGYARGYGNSDEASVGRVPNLVLEDNDRPGTFNGSHLMAPEEVPGLVMSNRKVASGEHDLTDLTVEVLARYGIEPAAGMHGRRVLE
jgi:predicted AlkP superfamily phosphohydrolase/phosphomutase